MRQHFATLNLKEGSSLKEVKKASRRLLLKHHPDLHPNNKTWAQEKTKKILNAYNILSSNLSTGITFKTTEEIKKDAWSKPKTTDIPLMYFSLGDIYFALDVKNIRYIDSLDGIKITKITSRKGLYPFISGIINHKGTLAPLLDLGQKLHIESIELKHQILVCEIENQPLALIIDTGKGIINIHMNDYNNQKYVSESDIPEQYVINVVKQNDLKIHILDLGKILTQ